MRVSVAYPVVKTINLEIPDELAKPWKKAKEEDDFDKCDECWEAIDDYVTEHIFNKEGAVDWIDWEEVD